jgi:streptomycin 6-kinase
VPPAAAMGRSRAFRQPSRLTPARLPSVSTTSQFDARTVAIGVATVLALRSVFPYDAGRWDETRTDCPHRAQPATEVGGTERRARDRQISAGPLLDTEPAKAVPPSTRPSLAAAVEIPDKLRYNALRWGDEGRRFLARVPGVVAELATRWSLTMGQSCSPGGATAYVARATRHDGSPAVVKVTFPHREARHEGAALRVYGGNGAVRIYDEAIDERAYVVLLEACEPGRPLAEEPDDELVVSLAAGVLVRLWQPVHGNHPFESLAHLALDWSVAAEERLDRFEPAWDPGLVREGIRMLRELPPTAQKLVLLHQDFHARNILSARREPWLAIDPKPVVGDPAFDPVHLIVQVGDLLARDDPSDQVTRRLKILSDLLGVDEQRIQWWALARCVVWALWSLERSDSDSSERCMAWARAIASAK